MNINPRLILIVIILLILVHYSRGGCCGNSGGGKPEQFGFKDFNDYSNVREMELKRTRYNGKSLWTEINGKILTIVGGDSDGHDNDDGSGKNNGKSFNIGRKFRLKAKERNWYGDHPDGSKSNMPFFYMETSKDGKEWTLHPEYSAPGDSISFEGYDTINMYTPGGNLKFVRYPNGRIWLSNDANYGMLSTIELTDLKIPFLKEDDPEEGANMTTSALGGHKENKDN